MRQLFEINGRVYQRATAVKAATRLRTRNNVLSVAKNMPVNRRKEVR